MKKEEKLILENLSAWRKDMEPPLRLSLLQLREAAKNAASAFRRGEIRDARDLRPLLPPIENEDSPFSFALQIEEELSFCHALLGEMPDFLQKSGLSLPREGGKETIAPSEMRIATVNSIFSAKALDLFQQVVPEARPFYVSGFSNVTEELAGGGVPFGILPIEDSGDGKLLHFYRQIDREELHISHTADVSYPDGNRTVRFAFLYRNTPPPQTAVGEELLECSLLGEGRHTLFRLLGAALACGFTLRSVDTVPADIGEDSFYYYPIFRTGKGQIGLFETYLALYLPRAVVVGHYQHLKENKS